LNDVSLAKAETGVSRSPAMSNGGFRKLPRYQIPADNKKPITGNAGDGFWCSSFLACAACADDDQYPSPQEWGHHQRFEVWVVFIGRGVWRGGLEGVKRERWSLKGSARESGHCPMRLSLWTQLNRQALNEAIGRAGRLGSVRIEE
jgi:hypothetical protein